MSATSSLMNSSSIMLLSRTLLRPTCRVVSLPTVAATEGEGPKVLGPVLRESDEEGLVSKNEDVARSRGPTAVLAGDQAPDRIGLWVTST